MDGTDTYSPRPLRRPSTGADRVCLNTQFDDVVFGLYDTGELNLRNEAAIFKEKYALDEVHGPVKTQFGYHLIKIDTRYIADFDFRLKEEGVREI